ncbi:hypothetical protein CEXT_556331 [Caerostris extrusa]|uniref:Secreted protein n=1 Tax=Caerostris extrusa TaxID=172846 RepID=A0AAV4X2V2_CAEEX|nr:hypothetical protein CEXT_556331 [Caerostris extrusa]
MAAFSSILQSGIVFSLFHSIPCLPFPDEARTETPFSNRLICRRHHVLGHWHVRISPISCYPGGTFTYRRSLGRAHSRQLVRHLFPFVFHLLRTVGSATKHFLKPKVIGEMLFQFRGTLT